MKRWTLYEDLAHYFVYHQLYSTLDFGHFSLDVWFMSVTPIEIIRALVVLSVLHWNVSSDDENISGSKYYLDCIIGVSEKRSDTI